MAQMTGADIGDLESGAARLESVGSQIGGMRRPLRSQLYSSHWEGRAAERFRNRWDTVHGPALSNAEAFLHNAGRRLRAEADQQRRASNMGGGGRGATPAALVALLEGRKIGVGWSGSTAWAEREGGWTSEDGNASVSGSVAVLSAEGDARARMGMDGDQFAAGASIHGRAALIEAQAQAHYGNDWVAANAKADAMIGAEAGGDVETRIGLDGVSADAEVGAFAGARATASADVDVGGVGAKGSAEAWAGVGAKADASASFTMDEVSIGASAGLALGVGGSIGGKVTVSPKKMIERLKPWNW